MLRTLVASATATAFLATGCGADRPWPAHPVAFASQSFARQGQVSTIDVLPLDLALWTEPGYAVDLDELRGGAEVNVMNAALETLAKRNYAVNAMIDWNGDFAGGSALSKDDLLATVSSLGHYGATAAEHPGQLPQPFLPARLGTTTGSDATLYVGGWSYVAAPRESTGDQIVEGIVVGLLILSVVAIIAAVAGGGKSGGKSHGGSSSHGHAPSVPSTAGHGSGGHVSGGHHVFTASRGVEHVHVGGAARAATNMADAFGNLALELAVTPPDWGEDPALPHEGAASQMYLEMTLVDNHTGVVLWHAHQTFPACAQSAGDTARVAHTMLSLMPPRAVQTAGN